MRIESRDTVNAVRANARGRCELCGHACRSLEVHHIFARGMGAANHHDHGWNLIALGGPWDCNHHGLAENGKVKRAELIAKVARREQLSAAEVLAELLRLRRLDKDGREPRRVTP